MAAGDTRLAFAAANSPQEEREHCGERTCGQPIIRQPELGEVEHVLVAIKPLRRTLVHSDRCSSSSRGSVIDTMCGRLETGEIRPDLGRFWPTASLIR